MAWRINSMDTFFFNKVLIQSILLFFVTTLALVYIFKRKRKAWLINQIPGPKTYPIIGNFLDVNVERRELFKLVQSLCDHNIMGPMIRIWLASVPYILIYKARGVEVILSSQKYLDKSKDYLFLQPWLGTGLLTSTGKKWHSRRKMLTPTFHFKILEDFVEIFNQESVIFCEKLSTKCDGKPFDIFKYISLCTLDIILESAMGRTINAQENSESEYVKAVGKMASLVQIRQRIPWLQPDLLFKLFGYESQQKKCLKILHEFSYDTIKECKKEFARKKNIKTEDKIDEEIVFTLGGKRKRLAFLDLLLEYSEGDDSMTDEDIREEVDTFMFEGHDTTAAAINWSIYLLATHPEIQQQVHDELDKIFGNSDRPITSADLKEMKLLDYCIKEALRLFPSVPAFARKLQEDTLIDGYMVPSGTTAIIVSYVLHRDPIQFPDPEKFDPERFRPENCVKRHPYAYVPFSAGPRNCIGQKFAQMEEKIVIANLFRKYRVESTVRREDLIILTELIMRPEDGNFVKLYPRN